jgi:hypothetical protein
MCYFPLPIAAQGLAAADYIIGNEVAFDSVAAFNRRCNRRCGRSCAAFPRFPPFSGLNTHFPMTDAVAAEPSSKCASGHGSKIRPGVPDSRKLRVHLANVEF